MSAAQLLDAQTVATVVLSAVTLIVTLWNRMTLAEMHAEVAELKSGLQAAAEERCNQCRQSYITRNEVEARLLAMERLNALAVARVGESTNGS